MTEIVIYPGVFKNAILNLKQKEKHPCASGRIHSSALEMIAVSHMS